MHARFLLRPAAALAVLLTTTAPAAASLASHLHRFVEDNSSLFVGVADTLTPTIERLAARATTPPATSTVPGFSYVLDYESGALVRAPGSFGAVFVDRPETVGKNVVAFGASYLHADLDDFDGDSLAGELDFRSRVATDAGVARTSLDFTDLTVTVDALSPFVTYGLTDRWDVSLLLPLLRTALSARANQSAVLEDPVDPVRIRDTVSLDEDAYGVGDLLLRTKYRLVGRDDFGLAAILGIRAPTGDAEDFQGLGDWRVEPQLVGARRFGAHDFHLALGVEVNSDALSRSRALYAVGTALQVHPRVAALVDVIGSSAFVADEFEIDALGTTPRSEFLEQFYVRPPQRLGGLRTRFFSSVPRTDTVDLAVGAKMQIFSRAAAFVSVLVPIVRDGFRTSTVVPAAGVEYTF